MIVYQIQQNLIIPFVFLYYIRVSHVLYQHFFVLKTSIVHENNIGTCKFKSMRKMLKMKSQSVI